VKKLFAILLAAITFAATAQDITGAGATFPAPLYSKWASEYNKSTGIRINYQSVGSGAGIKQIEAKTVVFGASDMPLADDLDYVALPATVKAKIRADWRHLGLF